MSMKTASVAEAVEAAKNGHKSMTRCPVHEDSTASLSVGPGQSQPVVMQCMAGCQTEDILAAEGIEWGEIAAEAEEKPKQNLWVPGNGTATDIYPYYDAQGVLRYEVLRAYEDGKKRFFQRQPDSAAKSGYRWNLDGVERLLYRLPQVIETVRGGGTIHIAEGEKCVHALLDAIPEGDEATCNSGGAGRFLPEFAEVLAGANVIVYADADDPGREHAREVREMLTEVGCVVTILEAPPGIMPNGKPIKDIADHLEAGLSLSQMLETTPGSQAERARSAVDWLDAVERPDFEFDFIIPGMLARTERLLMVGLEGHGKSTLLRQIASCVASGLHPFSGEQIEARRVLYIDAENHPGQVAGGWRRMKHILEKQEANLQRGMLHILEEWDSEIDLTTQKGRIWLKERVHAYKPDLLIMGPLKNLVQRNLSDHETVNQLRYTINSARTISECAVIMEHHAPLRMSGDRERELRPYGSGLFLGWPDFGYAMKPTQNDGIYEWQPFRGDRVRERQWPDGLRWGRGIEFPWMPCHPEIEESH